MIWLVSLFGCPSAPDPAPLSCDGVTWEAHAGPFVDAWCLDCHHSARTGVQRSGAPVGVDFDDPEQVVERAPSMVALSSGEAAPMPPEGGPSTRERTGFAVWAQCGAPLPVEDRCAGLTLEGDVSASEAPADLCPDTRWVTGDLRVDADPSAVACLCGVGGDLRIGATAPAVVALPELRTIQGGLEMEGTGVEVLDLPALQRAGRVHVVDNPSLRGVPLSALAEVDGSLTVRGNLSVDNVDLRGLVRVDGPLDLRANAAMRGLLAPSGLTVLPDALDLSDTPSLLALDGFDGVEEVIGPVDVRRSGTDRLRLLPDARRIGGLSLVDLPDVREITAFGSVTRVTGSLWISAVGPVLEFDLLGEVTQVDGSVVVDRVSGLTTMGLGQVTAIGGGLLMSENPDLTSLAGLRHVPRLAGLMVAGHPHLASLEGLHGLTEVDGDVRITSNAVLEDLEGLRSLVSVGGDLVIEGNPVLERLDGLVALQSVDGSVRIAGASMDLTAAEAFLTGVTIGGQLVLEP